MTPTTPREALEAVRIGGQPLRGWEQKIILTALAPYLRTPGTVEVCRMHKNSRYCKDADGKYRQYCTEYNCPIKQVTNEKA